jgi:hypothetical protein
MANSRKFQRPCRLEEESGVSDMDMISIGPLENVIPRAANISSVKSRASVDHGLGTIEAQK